MFSLWGWNGAVHATGGCLRARHMAAGSGQRAGRRAALSGNDGKSPCSVSLPIFPALPRPTPPRRTPRRGLLPSFSVGKNRVSCSNAIRWRRRTNERMRLCPHFLALDRQPRDVSLCLSLSLSLSVSPQLRFPTHDPHERSRYFPPCRRILESSSPLS